MAKLTNMPNQEVISGFKGVIDFYLYMGVPCARTWPRTRYESATPNARAQWPRFAYAVRLWQQATKIVRDAYESLPPPTGLTGRDMFMRAYISGIFRYTTQDPPS